MKVLREVRSGRILKEEPTLFPDDQMWSVSQREELRMSPKLNQ